MKSALLDADAAIEALEVHSWDGLVAKARILMTRAVANQVTHFEDRTTGEVTQIDLEPYIADGRVEIVECDSTKLKRVYAVCRGKLELHVGEAESLAALPDLCADCCFCSGDKAAIQALVLLDLQRQAVCLDRVLGDCGAPRASALSHQFCQDYLDYWLHKGRVLKAQTTPL